MDYLWGYLVLFVDPSGRIDSLPAEEQPIEEEYSRMILAHELGHAAVRSTDKTRITLDRNGDIASVNVYESGFGAVTEPIDLPDDNYWEGSVASEGFATLMASRLYRALEEVEVPWTFGSGVPVMLPGWLLSHVENNNDLFTADNHALGALTIARFDEKYPGLINDMEAVAKRKITVSEFKANLDARQPGLYDKLHSAQHTLSHIAVAREVGVEILD